VVEGTEKKHKSSSPAHISDHLATVSLPNHTSLSERLSEDTRQSAGAALQTALARKRRVEQEKKTKIKIEERGSQQWRAAKQQKDDSRTDEGSVKMTLMHIRQQILL